MRRDNLWRVHSPVLEIPCKREDEDVERRRHHPLTRRGHDVERPPAVPGEPPTLVLPVKFRLSQLPGHDGDDEADGADGREDGPGDEQPPRRGVDVECGIDLRPEVAAPDPEGHHGAREVNAGDGRLLEVGDDGAAKGARQAKGEGDGVDAVAAIRRVS